MATQTGKRGQDDSDEEEEDMGGFEIAGLDKWLNRMYPKIAAMLDQNLKSNIFAGYDVLWDDDSLEETVMTHKLVTDFDFVEANSVNKQTDKKLAEAEKKRRGNAASQGNDDDFDDFNYDPRD